MLRTAEEKQNHVGFPEKNPLLRNATKAKPPTEMVQLKIAGTPPGHPSTCFHLFQKTVA